MNIFRNEAINSKRRRLWGDVRLAQRPSLAIWTVVMSIVCISILLIFTFTRYTRKETVQGFLAPEAGVVQVRATQPGRILNVFVQEGDNVAKGQVLMQFVTDSGGFDRGPALDIQINEASLQLDAIAHRKSATMTTFSDEIHILQEQLNAQYKRRPILLNQREIQESALEISKADLDRILTLQAQGYAPALEVDRRRRGVIAEQSALAEMDVRIADLDAAASELRARIGSVPSRQQEAIARIDADAASIEQRRSELEAVRGYVLRAPVSGMVSGVQARVGMTPNDLPLLSISPEGSKLEAYLLVPTRGAGFLRIGQSARLQVHAFPFQRFGFVEGNIKSISTSVIRPGEAMFPIEHTEPVYQVRVELARDYVSAYGEKRPLQPGMTLVADIPIDQRRLWQQLFDPLLATGKRMNL